MKTTIIATIETNDMVPIQDTDKDAKEIDVTKEVEERIHELFGLVFDLPNFLKGFTETVRTDEQVDMDIDDLNQMGEVKISFEIK